MTLLTDDFRLNACRICSKCYEREENGRLSSFLPLYLLRHILVKIYPIRSRVGEHRSMEPLSRFETGVCLFFLALEDVVNRK